MKRVFIAIKVEAGGELQRMVATIKALLGNEKIKWVDIQYIHVTLAFLGDTEEKRISPLTVLLKDRCSGFGDFKFTLVGTGVFRNLRDPKIIWAGIRSNGELNKLSDLIYNGLKTENFDFDEKPFKPHLTLGRVKSIKNTENLSKILEMYKDTEFQAVIVKEVILFESILYPTGSVYKPIYRFPLN